MKKVLGFLLIFVTSSYVNSQTTEGYIQVRGLGQIGCGEYISWVDTKNKPQLDLVGQWAWGFMTGYQMRGSFNKNTVTTKQGNIRTPDLDTTNLYLKKYCSTNPLSNILNGVIEMIKELGGVIASK
jgi:hypothetical protein